MLKLSRPLTNKDIRKVNITKEEEYWFYKDIVDNDIHNRLSSFKKILEDQIREYKSGEMIKNKINKMSWPPSNKKNILFIDFNGVISYKLQYKRKI